MTLLDAFAGVRPVITAIEAAGGWPIIVGGAVRDALLGLPAKDIDIEVYRLTFEQLLAALTPWGKTQTVGKSFGVIKLRRDGREIDVSLPSRARGGVQQGEIAPPDLAMTPREAAARRDFTCNAIAIAPDGGVLDFFNGRADLQARVLRHTSAQFGDDPLRVLRAMQFAARFAMTVAPETVAVCRDLLPVAPSLPVERVWGEWHKWAVQGVTPSAGLRVLHETGWITLYSELAALVSCPQDPIWHPEGDVWIHTLHVCDAAAAIAVRDELNGDERAALLFAALCHDFGKPSTTVHEPNGRITSRGHDQASVALAKSFLARIGAPHTIIQRVLPLIGEHMAHLAQPTIRAVRRLAVRLQPATVEAWARLVEADHSGRPPLPPHNPAEAALTLARQMQIALQPPTPLVRGRDLIAAGYGAGPQLGALVRRAYEAQLDGAFGTTEAGLTWLAQYAQDIR